MTYFTMCTSEAQFVYVCAELCLTNKGSAMLVDPGNLQELLTLTPLCKEKKNDTKEKKRLLIVEQFEGKL